MNKDGKLIVFCVINGLLTGLITFITGVKGPGGLIIGLGMAAAFGLGHYLGLDRRIW